MEDLVNSFGSIYKGSKVLVTGNTGFKGTWLTEWLIRLGADVFGFANEVPTSPSMYKILGIDSNITQYWGDISDFSAVSDVVERVAPDFIFHFAAQALVGVSYEKPLETISTNVIGGANLLEVLRNYESDVTVVFITSDKAYENVEMIWGYRESDRIGGKDIYSSSKGAIDIIAKSYFESFFKEHPCLKFGLARAGNVIGGGDWARDRIVVDAINSWGRGESVTLRCPQATRPWQHVLEPLSGYLRLGQALRSNLIETSRFNDFNFGPGIAVNQTVAELIDDLSAFVVEGDFEPYIITDNIPFNESHLLKLNCEKALLKLSWQSILNYQETVEFTGSWYKEFIYGDINKIKKVTFDQLSRYTEKAVEMGAKWV